MEISIQQRQVENDKIRRLNEVDFAILQEEKEKILEAICLAKSMEEFQDLVKKRLQINPLTVFFTIKRTMKSSNYSVIFRTKKFLRKITKINYVKFMKI